MIGPSKAVSLTCLGLMGITALTVAVGAAHATSRRGEAEVRMQDGQLCFTISAKEAKRGPSFRLQALIVSDESKDSTGTVWSMALDHQRPQAVSPSTCFLYGQTPEGARSSPALAPELQTGRVYSVYLNTRPSDSSDPTHGQDAKFCFMPDPAGGRRLIEVKYGMRAWDTGRCE